MVIFSEEEQIAISNLAVAQALAALNPYQRFLAFTAMKGYKHEELAEMFETSRSAIGHTLARMRKKVGHVLGI